MYIRTYVLYIYILSEEHITYVTRRRRRDVGRREISGHKYSRPLGPAQLRGGDTLVYTYILWCIIKRICRADAVNCISIRGESYTVWLCESVLQLRQIELDDIFLKRLVRSWYIAYSFSAWKKKFALASKGWFVGFPSVMFFVLGRLLY